MANPDVVLRRFSRVGCSLAAFRAHIEAQWLSGMTWDNYGRAGGVSWQLDHIRPRASFTFLNESDWPTFCRYTNIRPVWWETNEAKGSMYEGKDCRQDSRRAA
jgi:hypothetical protein